MTGPYPYGNRKGEKRRSCCKVVSGGEYLSHKGVNFPDVDCPFRRFTAKDRRDLEFILSAMWSSLRFPLSEKPPT
jgi:pyruvate kinase